MEWWLILLILLGGMMVLFFTGMPIAMGLLIMTIIGIVMFWGGWNFQTFQMLTVNIRESTTLFVMLPLPLFILIGELLFRTGIATNLLDALANWMGRIPGRLSLLAMITGTLFATMTGMAMASTAMLGEMLVPEMIKRGYKNDLIMGPIMGAGTLAPMIPPSAAAIFIGVIAQISIGRMLIASIVPGLLMAAVFFVYILIRCLINPSLAPKYEAPRLSLSKKLKDSAYYILPLGLVVFLVTGVIMLGIASPSEAAATGAVGALLLTVFYRKLKWGIYKSAILGTIELSTSLFLILMTAVTFSQVLAISGASPGLAKMIIGLHLPPLAIIAAMQILIMILGCFIAQNALTMIFIPLFIPIVKTLGFDPVWFCVMFLVNCELGNFTPPFGTSLFVMKVVGPKNVTMGEIIHSAVPFIIMITGIIFLIMFVPSIALWLPSIAMK